jgi:hypothetical protein
MSIGGRSEPQSSSGVLIATGAGSTGWLSSVFNMAAGLAGAFSRAAAPVAAGAPHAMRLEWEDPRLVYVVREPFASKSSRTSLVAGVIEPGEEIAVESEMPSNGVIFSDGVEADYIEFNAGATARIRTAQRKARLVVSG